MVGEEIDEAAQVHLEGAVGGGVVGGVVAQRHGAVREMGTAGWAMVRPGRAGTVRPSAQKALRKRA